jgi:hypothetical protein
MGRGDKKDINSEALREQNETVRFMHFLNLVCDELEVIEERKKNIKNIKKKAALFDVRAKDIDYAVKALENTDQQVPVEEYKRHGQVLQMLNFMPQFNPSLLLDRMPADERIIGEGRIQGLRGRPAEPPYAKGSKENEQYMTGWDAGNKLRMERLADALDESQLPAASKAGKSVLVKKAEAAKKDPNAPLGDLPPEAVTQDPEMPSEPAKKGTRAQKAGDVKDGRTNAEIEMERQAKADFH